MAVRQGQYVMSVSFASLRILQYDIEAAVHSWLAQPGSFTPWLAPQTDTEHEVELTEDEIARNEDFLESKSRATGWT